MAWQNSSDAARREFSKRLKAELDKKGWTQSDLARAMFGKEEGSGAASRRYQIGSYYHGHSMPRPAMLDEICKALGVPHETLAPKHVVKETTEPLMSFVQTSQTTAEFAVAKQEMPLSKALRIMAILSEPDE